jgi:uncharacterized protein YbaP (TraB family)
MQQTTLQLGLVDENDSLEKQVGAEAFAKVSARARELDMDPSLLNRFKPWLAALTLTQLTLMKHGLDPNSGVEQRFVARAAQDGKEIRGLETIQQQLGMLAGLPPKQQREFLLYSVEDSEHATQEIDALISAWRKGDTPSLAALLQDGFDEFPDLYRPLTVERNQAWMNRLESLLKDEDDCLVIVGALHLVGKDSVVDLLERKGYVVKQK